MRELLQEEITKDIYPFMVQMYKKMVREGQDLVLDHVKAYNAAADFLGGKVINFCSYVVLHILKEDEYEEGLGDLRRMIVLCADMPMETWGILKALEGLYRLQRCHLLGRVVAQKELAKLKKVLDFRTFVDLENDCLRHGLPTNYYGVAFGIARFRELLGWEDEESSRKLLTHLDEHIRNFSDELGFMDETRGEGRFDRYSIVIPAELAENFLKTGAKVPEFIRNMLRASAEICLHIANDTGFGICYGRSTGAYGDTAVLQILDAACRVPELLSAGEQKLAYGYCTRIIRHFCDYWIDEDMGSVNLWEKGRGTDYYRNKNRILGETINLCNQIVSLYDWHNPGCTPDMYGEMLRSLEARGVSFFFVPFAKNRYQRGLVLVRDEKDVWMLPLISGGERYYSKSAYLPIPYQPGRITGIPEYDYRLLLPALTTDQGEVLMPTVYIKNITVEKGEGAVRISYTQDALCVLTDQGPREYPGVHSETTYIFGRGEIERKDVFYIEEDIQIQRAEMEFLSFSKSTTDELRPDGIQFEEGGIRGIIVSGYDSAVRVDVQNTEAYHTPDGQINSHIRWKKEKTVSDRLAVSWKIRY